MVPLTADDPEERHQRRGAVSRRAESDVAAVRHDHRGQRVDGRGG